MPSVRNPRGLMVALATNNALTGTVDGSQILDLKGSGGAVIIQMISTDGTAGVDVIEFSRDGGTTWAAATAALIGRGSAGLLKSDGTAAASAALNAAGAEAVTPATAVFVLAPPDGPFHIRCARGGAGAGGTAWVTGAPYVSAVRFG